MLVKAGTFLSSQTCQSFQLSHFLNSVTFRLVLTGLQASLPSFLPGNPRSLKTAENLRLSSKKHSLCLVHPGSHTNHVEHVLAQLSLGPGKRVNKCAQTSPCYPDLMATLCLHGLECHPEIYKQAQLLCVRFYVHGEREGFLWAGQMAQWLTALAALAEDRVQLPAPNKSHIKCFTLPVTPVPRALTTSCGLCWHLRTHKHTNVTLNNIFQKTSSHDYLEL